jgi:hypothetical protein
MLTTGHAECRHEIVYFEPGWEDGRPRLSERGRKAVAEEYERSKTAIREAGDVVDAVAAAAAAAAAAGSVSAT